MLNTILSIMVLIAFTLLIGQLSFWLFTAVRDDIRREKERKNKD